MNFNVTEHEKFIYIVSYSPLQLTFPLEFFSSINEKYSQLPDEAAKIFLFYHEIFWEAGFSANVSIKTIYNNRLNGEAYMIIQLTY